MNNGPEAPPKKQKLRMNKESAIHLMRKDIILKELFAIFIVDGRPEVKFDKTQDIPKEYEYPLEDNSEKYAVYIRLDIKRRIPGRVYRRMSFFLYHDDQGRCPITYKGKKTEDQTPIPELANMFVKYSLDVTLTDDKFHKYEYSLALTEINPKVANKSRSFEITSYETIHEVNFSQDSQSCVIIEKPRKVKKNPIQQPVEKSIQQPVKKPVQQPVEKPVRQSEQNVIVISDDDDDEKIAEAVDTYYEKLKSEALKKLLDEKVKLSRDVENLNIQFRKLNKEISAAEIKLKTLEANNRQNEETEKRFRHTLAEYWDKINTLNQEITNKAKMCEEYQSHILFLECQIKDNETLKDRCEKERLIAEKEFEEKVNYHKAQQSQFLLNEEEFKQRESELSNLRCEFERSMVEFETREQNIVKSIEEKNKEYEQLIHDINNGRKDLDNLEKSFINLERFFREKRGNNNNNNNNSSEDVTGRMRIDRNIDRDVQSEIITSNVKRVNVTNIDSLQQLIQAGIETEKRKKLE